MAGANVPWPVWALVTVLVAAIGATGTIVATNPCAFPALGFCDDGAASAGTTTYLMDNLEHRRIVLAPNPDGSFRAEEASSPWPWTGTVRIDGGALDGMAAFEPPSLATMRLDGTVRSDGSIRVDYIFVTGSDGQPAERRTDRHVWYPLE